MQAEILSGIYYIINHIKCNTYFIVIIVYFHLSRAIIDSCLVNRVRHDIHYLLEGICPKALNFIIRKVIIEVRTAAIDSCRS